MTHIYRGNCPDEIQPDARDEECEACRQMSEIAALHALCDEMGEALGFYEDETRYYGPNQRIDTPDAWSERVGLSAYRLDVTRDRGNIARAALAKWMESK